MAQCQVPIPPVQKAMRQLEQLEGRYTATDLRWKMTLSPAWTGEQAGKTFLFLFAMRQLHRRKLIVVFCREI
jgi:hypothetical protein